MNDAVTGSRPNSPAIAPTAVLATRPMYWSLRRELWEHCSVYISFLAAAAVYAVSYFISLRGLPRDIRSLPKMDLTHQHVLLATPYTHAGMFIMTVAFVVGIFFCLDTLHGERRDRSILFWKSLPVSDRTTLLAKASIPFVVLPLLTFAITVVLQWIMLLASILALAASGAGAATLWATLPICQLQLVLLYSVAVLTLWHAPIYAWLLLVSGWARRAAFLWAVLPPAAVVIFEMVAFRSSHFRGLLRDRMWGFAAAAFNFTTPEGPLDVHFIPLAQLTPGKFLASPGLWMGLIVAAGFFAAAVRLRRYREPL